MALWKKVSFVCSLLIGALALILGIVALTVVERFVNKNVLERDYLGYENFNGSRRLNSMTGKWLHPEYRMELQIWMYNLTNMADVLNGAKPVVEEIGPFTFIERQSKSFYQFETNDTRIFYRNTYVYHFNESLSCPNCSLDQVVIIPNVVFQKLVDFAAHGIPEQIAVKAALIIAKRETPFLNVTVREALFEGYKDPLLEIACGYPAIKYLCEAAKIPTRIGFFYEKNNTDDGLYEVSTGLGDAFTIGKVFTFNNMSIMPDTTWDSADARQIRGTDGQLFPPMLEEGRDLEIFTGPMCRSIPMEFRRRSEFEDIAAFRYAFPSKMFDPSVPENRGFCNKNNTPTFFNASIQIPGCLPKGLLDISRCVPGSPRIYVSNSHFFNAHPEVQSSIKGMAVPNEHDDQTLVDVEPTSGVPIFAKRATQINVGMVHGNLDLLAKMPNLIMPVLWMNETAAFDSDTRSQLSGLTSIKHIVYVVGVTFLTVGLLMLFAVIVAVVLQTVLKPRGEEEESIIQDVDVEEEVGDI